jgi:hypothetical protein
MHAKDFGRHSRFLSIDGNDILTAITLKIHNQRGKNCLKTAL